MIWSWSPRPWSLLHHRLAIAYDRLSGQQQWLTQVQNGPFDYGHPKNSHASSTPCCNGRLLFVVFNHSGRLFANALELTKGAVVWETELGEYASDCGFSSSPTLFGDLLFIASESSRRPKVVALHCETGEVVWRTRLALEGAGYSSPIIAPSDSGGQLVLPASRQIVSLAPASGEALWTADWSQTDVAATATTADNRLFVVGNYTRPEIVALDLSNEGTPRELWTATRGASRVPSPLVTPAGLLLINDSGVASCLDIDTGDVKWRERLKGDFSASPLLVGDTIYAANEQGHVFVMRAGKTLERIATHSLGDGVYASPVFCGGQLLLRTATELVCVSSSGNSPTTP